MLTLDDWAGPFSVPDGVAQLAATNSNTAYDPVDTCICNEGTLECLAVNGPVSARNCFISSFVMFVQV